MPKFGELPCRLYTLPRETTFNALAPAMLREAMALLGRKYLGYSWMQKRNHLGPFHHGLHHSSISFTCTRKLAFFRRETEVESRERLTDYKTTLSTQVSFVFFVTLRFIAEIQRCELNLRRSSSNLVIVVLDTLSGVVRGKDQYALREDRLRHHVTLAIWQLLHLEPVRVHTTASTTGTDSLRHEHSCGGHTHESPAAALPDCCGAETCCCCCGGCCCC